MNVWAQEQGMRFGAGLGGEAGRGALGELGEEERTALRATRQAMGGGQRGPGKGSGLANLTEQERESMQATAEASGFGGGGSRPSGPQAEQTVMMASPVVELLTERAAE
jgi:hypothetical protein